MSLSTSPELFINMKNIPTVDSEEYDAFFKNETDKITYGVTINGVYIHGWLYWHLNHWHIYLDEKDPRNPSISKRKWENPQFRDNEWLIAENIKKAEDLKKGLLLFGSRRVGKTIFESSWLGRGATIYEGSENVLAGTNEADIKVLASALDKGLSAMHPYYRFQRLQDDWRKEVSLGVREKRVGGKRYEWSKIWIRNLDEGKNTEAIAGTTPTTLVIDEVGKHNWLEAFSAAMPGFASSLGGWRCTPIACGTGGNCTPNSDAEKVFKGPDAFNFLAVEWPGIEKKIGVFMPGSYRMDAKKPANFADFLERKSGILIPKNSELAQMPFFESDENVAKKLIKDEFENAKKGIDPKASLKARMYYPQHPLDCFLSDSVNDFPLEAIQQHLIRLEEQNKAELIARPVDLYRNLQGKVSFSYQTKLKEIRDFPVTSETIKDAPIMIYEEPVDNPSPYLYIAGGDPYNQNTSAASPSLGTIYIYKRLYDPVAGSFQNMIVASWAARPRQMKEWNKTAEMLLELYSATLMIENAGTNFIEYMDGKNKGFMLADGYNLLREISPNTGIRDRPKGLPATPAVIRHCMNLLYDYCNEEIQVLDAQSKLVTVLGVVRIKDVMLLTEMLNYNLDGNFDRIVAFRHVLAYNQHLQKINPIVKFSDVPELPTTPQVHYKPSPFLSGRRSPFNLGRNTPF